ncbi:MAG: hypothetical protein EAS52_07720 [Parapedobacter sp.]|nr:MAG: hypothetical protein EAS52_07720 [Parapedobacter sp.]
MITTKKHVMTAALAALMLTGVLHEKMTSTPVLTPYAAIPTVLADSVGDDGSICLDTKFFLPFRAEEQLSADNGRRETLYALLSTYE